jgi:membrane protein implicated in regulation of membrane protease activity
MIFQIDAWLFWLILLAIFLIAEAMSFNLTTIWFAAGALAALVLDLVGFSIEVQITVMIVMSAILLASFIVFIRPRMSRGRNKRVATNADRMIGQEALVSERIDPIQGTGQVRVLGQTWSASSANSQPIEPGNRVIIIELRGVKAIVTIKEDNHD